MRKANPVHSGVPQQATVVQWAAALSSVVAAIGLLVSAYQTRQFRRSVSLQALVEFSKAANERERALNLGDAPTKQHAFVEFLNFLELYAASYNGQLFVGVARELVEDKLIDSLVILECAPEWRTKIEEATTSQIAFKHLGRFMKQHRTTISARCEAYRRCLSSRSE